MSSNNYNNNNNNNNNSNNYDNNYHIPGVKPSFNPINGKKGFVVGSFVTFIPTETRRASD